MSIEEQEALIAEFDKYELDGITLTKRYIHWCANRDKKYSTSWNWLMPVVKKCFILNGSFGFFEANLFYNADIEGVYKNVVKIILWHNKNTPHT